MKIDGLGSFAYLPGWGRKIPPRKRTVRQIWILHSVAETAQFQFILGGVHAKSTQEIGRSDREKFQRERKREKKREIISRNPNKNSRGPDFFFGHYFCIQMYSFITLCGVLSNCAPPLLPAPRPPPPSKTPPRLPP